MYYVYCHTSKTTRKSYIGYTGKTISFRFQQHYNNAMSGVDTHFYRAIRKYGIDDFETKILWTGSSISSATDQEIHFIDTFNTQNEGYNMTAGGTGGWTVPDQKYDNWLKHCSRPKESNGRWSGHSDEEILECAYEYFKYNPNSVRAFRYWSSEKYGMPKHYNKNRFNGKKFEQAYAELYGVILEYKKTNDHKKKLSVAGLGKRWYTNNSLKQSKQFTEQPGEDWVLGRKYGH